MRRRLIVVMSSIAVLCVLSIPVFHSAAAKSAPSPAAPPAAAPPSSHPEYHDTIEALRNARRHLEKAEADGYGHRDRAMQAKDAALDECNQALQVLH
ncbi:MAG TPA: hypothetical protein VG206_27470 [Terriglobia bacterium]|nr:hypothetical protein [Terriglobia bacterium]